MNAQHTSGPWHIGARAFERAVYGERGEEIAVFSGLIPADEELANARLIAAAPELLNACELFEQAIAVNRHNLTREMRAAIDAARAALAKAKGEVTP